MTGTPASPRLSRRWPASRGRGEVYVRVKRSWAVCETMYSPRLRRVVVSAGAAVAVAAFGLSGVPAARADTAPAPGSPATVSADPLPTVQIDGVVWAQATVGNTVYV